MALDVNIGNMIISIQSILFKGVRRSEQQLANEFIAARIKIFGNISWVKYCWKSGDVFIGFILVDSRCYDLIYATYYAAQ